MLEKTFETLLWNSRLIVLAAVIASLAGSVAMFYMASVDAVIMISHMGEYASSGLSGEERVALRSATVTHVVEIVDGYLLATVLLIFSLGLYELFISKIDLAEGSESASNVLMITSLDDLKSRLAKVVMMILVVRYFEFALGMEFKSPLDLLHFAGGIALLGLALYLSHMADKGAAH
ncbi:MAG: YqhA family protein [Candidatus Thiodiazotropha sp.]